VRGAGRRARVGRGPALWFAALARRAAFLPVLAGLAPGCAGGRDLGAKLANAMVPSHLPLAMACWEKEFEASGFRGEYKATVDFTVTETGAVRAVKVRKLEGTDVDAAREPAFRACIEDALAHTVLPRSDDANGPGFAAASDLSVEGYVLAFVDASSQAREDAESRSQNVLIGPRSDRCQGLYIYDPPRGAVDLYTAIGQTDTLSEQTKGQPDPYARSLQKAYDLRLELRERLRRDLDTPDLPDANRKKLRAAIEEAEERAQAIGAAIGCKPPQ
jgi:hypothetical protein